MNSKPVRRLSFFQQQSFQIPESEDKVGCVSIPYHVIISRFYSTFPFQAGGQLVLDIIVENAGRINYGTPMDIRKGEKNHIHVYIIMYFSVLNLVLRMEKNNFNF